MSKGFKNLIIIASLLCVSCIAPGVSPPSQPLHLNPDLITTASDPVEVRNVLGDVFEVFDAPNLSLTEARARAAAVKVRSLVEAGHGSGSYLIAYGRAVVVTAAHVVRDQTVMAIDGQEGETVVGKVVFVDRENDLAFLVVPEMTSRTAVRYRPDKSYDERMIGTRLTYTGFPSHHELLTIRGYVSSLEHQMIVTNMFGWFGSSGSGVFDRRGRLVGVVSGIDIGHIGVFGMSIPLASIIWVAPVSMIDHQTLKARILTAETPGSINAFPGAMAPRRGGVRN